LRVGFLARLHPKKNLEVIIEAIARLGEEVELVVAGDGPEAYREALKALAVELGVSHRVAWLGFVDAKGKAEFLAQIDVLAMPSAYECFGVAAVEAMSTGVPLIVSPSVGVADIAARHGAALVVNPDPEHLAIAIARYASDRALLESAKQAARAAAQEFSPERHGERLESEYLRLISTSKNREFLREEGRHEVAG
jgi:glycosyltransferase involved in cell wall biosynthesis